MVFSFSICFWNLIICGPASVNTWISKSSLPSICPYIYLLFVRPYILYWVEGTSRNYTQIHVLFGYLLSWTISYKKNPNPNLPLFLNRRHSFSSKCFLLLFDLYSSSSSKIDLVFNFFSFPSFDWFYFGWFSFIIFDSRVRVAEISDPRKQLQIREIPFVQSEIHG